MATYYVGPGGSDAAAGTSWATRWLTISKALGSAGIASGDTLYVGPGTYRELVGVGMTSPTVETRIIGDTDGSHTSGVPGPVILTAHLTNDTTLAEVDCLVNLNGRDNLTFEGLIFIGGRADSNGGGSCVRMSWGVGSGETATNITFRDCQFLSNSTAGAMTLWSNNDIAWNWTIERCLFLGDSDEYPSGTISLHPVAPAAGVERNLNIVIRNCLFLGACALILGGYGSGTGSVGGVVFQNNTCISGLAALYVHQSMWTMATAATRTKVHGNVFIQLRNRPILEARNTSQIDEDYNYFWGAGTPRLNVSVGTNSLVWQTNAPAFSLGWEWLNGYLPRPFLSPLAGAAHLWRYPSSATPAPPTVDVLNRPRPAGGNDLDNVVGYVERHDTAVRETTIVDAGSTAIRLTGPADHDIHLPVDAVSTVITIRTRFDTNHGTATRPQVILLANDEIGVASQTVTATGPVDTWETLSLSAFTPTGKGWVTLRLRSRPAAASGTAYFDTLTVS